MSKKYYATIQDITPGTNEVLLKTKIDEFENIEQSLSYYRGLIRGLYVNRFRGQQKRFGVYVYNAKNDVLERIKDFRMSDSDVYK